MNTPTTESPSGKTAWDRREYWMNRFHVRKVSRHYNAMLRVKLLDQLDACKSDEARRIILGVSK